jgi:hypothetical protein
MVQVHDAAYWRERAEEARAIAEGMADPEAKRVMLSVAASYDWLAAHPHTGMPPRKEC